VKNKILKMHITQEEGRCHIALAIETGEKKFIVREGHAADLSNYMIGRIAETGKKMNPDNAKYYFVDLSATYDYDLGEFTKTDPLPDDLTSLSDLYEGIKDCLNNLTVQPDEEHHRQTAFEKLAYMRDIAAPAIVKQIEA
jgi:hypothetical protein